MKPTSQPFSHGCPLMRHVLCCTELQLMVAHPKTFIAAATTKVLLLCWSKVENTSVVVTPQNRGYRHQVLIPNLYANRSRTFKDVLLNGLQFHGEKPVLIHNLWSMIHVIVTIIGRGWAKYRDLSVASWSIISAEANNWSGRHWHITILSEFNNCFIIRSSSLFSYFNHFLAAQGSENHVQIRTNIQIRRKWIMIKKNGLATIAWQEKMNLTFLFMLYL